MKCFLYILQSKQSGRYYIGSSINPKKRTVQHNNGKVSSTRKRGPWILCFTQKYPNVTSARKAEYKLKRMKSKLLIEQIIKDGVFKMKI